jgi:hypothetical protein
MIFAQYANYAEMTKSSPIKHQDSTFNEWKFGWIILVFYLQRVSFARLIVTIKLS